MSDDPGNLVPPPPPESAAPGPVPPGYGAPYPPSAPKARIALGAIIAIVVAVLLLLGAGVFTGIRALDSGLRALQGDAGEIGNQVFNQIREGQYQAMWDNAAPEFRRTVTQDQFNRLMSTMDSTLGKPISWKAIGFKKQLYTGTNGTINMTTITFRVTHERGNASVNVSVDPDNRLLGIYFNMTP